jgi:glutathione S-transferase
VSAAGGEPAFTLHLGNKNYSSWSLRAYLAAAQTGARFREDIVWLNEPSFQEQIRVRSPSGRVPALTCGDLTVWDSLAIIEYLAERYPGAGLWPEEAAARARARAVSAEMHAGFAALREAMPMNIRARRPGVGHSPAALSDIARVVEIWRDCLARSGGPSLFGGLGAADCMYAPVVCRFETYAVEVPADLAGYADRVLAHPPMVRWARAAAAEPQVIAAEER